MKCAQLSGFAEGKKSKPGRNAPGNFPGQAGAALGSSRSVTLFFPSTKQMEKKPGRVAGAWETLVPYGNRKARHSASLGDATVSRWYPLLLPSLLGRDRLTLTELSQQRRSYNVSLRKLCSRR